MLESKIGAAIWDFGLTGCGLRNESFGFGAVPGLGFRACEDDDDDDEDDKHDDDCLWQATAFIQTTMTTQIMTAVINISPITASREEVQHHVSDAKRMRGW